MSRLHHWLASVYANTVELCTGANKTGSTDSNETKVNNLVKIRETCESEVFDSSKLETYTIEPLYYNTEIIVENQDVLISAFNHSKNGTRKVLILNLANQFVPGGSVEIGASTQEEEIFRRSNYCLTLKKKLYPIPNGGNIYTDKLVVFRSGRSDEYKLLEKPFICSAIAAAAICQPTLVEGSLSKKDKIHTIKTIDNIFRTAYLKGHDVLILGALGCGAFENPPLDIISIFNACLIKYNKCFRKIVFAVFSTGEDKNFSYFDKHIIRTSDSS